MTSKTRNELWPKKAQKKFQPATKIAAQTWPRFCHQIAPKPATGLMPSDMSQYPRTNTASRPSEASIIGKDLTITGDVTSKGELRIDGRVQGNVHCLSLILGENPEIKGDVKAEDVLIGGRLLGSVRGRRVILQSTAHVEGDLLHKDLAGGIFPRRVTSRRRSARCCPTRAKAKSACGRAATGASRRPKGAAVNDFHMKLTVGG